MREYLTTPVLAVCYVSDGAMERPPTDEESAFVGSCSGSRSEGDSQGAEDELTAAGQTLRKTPAFGTACLCGLLDCSELTGSSRAFGAAL